MIGGGDSVVVAGPAGPALLGPLLLFGEPPGTSGVLGRLDGNGRDAGSGDLIVHPGNLGLGDGDLPSGLAESSGQFPGPRLSLRDPFREFVVRRHDGPPLTRRAEPSYFFDSVVPRSIGIRFGSGIDRSGRATVTCRIPSW